MLAMIAPFLMGSLTIALYPLGVLWVSQVLQLRRLYLINVLG